MLFGMFCAALVASLVIFHYDKSSKVGTWLFLGSWVFLFLSRQESDRELEDRCFRGDQVACADIETNNAYREYYSNP